MGAYVAVRYPAFLKAISLQQVAYLGKCNRGWQHPDVEDVYKLQYYGCQYYFFDAAPQFFHAMQLALENIKRK
jgi:hypothetical protein